MGIECEFSSVDGLPAGLVGAGFHYSPFTAADGKIPLSMVQVKLKPLYVVICLRLRALDHKTLDFSCGKLVGSGTAAVGKARETPICAANAVKILPISPDLGPTSHSESLALTLAGNKVQEWCNSLIPLVQMWGNGDGLRVRLRLGGTISA